MTDQSDEKWTTAAGLGSSAAEYIEAALQLGGEPDHLDRFTRPGDPAYFLVHHALELSFKAFLRHRGHSVDQLMALGHVLPKLYRVAFLKHSLGDFYTPSCIDREVIRWLAKVNHKNGLRYRQTGLYNYPPWWAVMAVAIRLHQAIAPILDIFPVAPHLKFPASWPEDWQAEREDGIARERRVLVQFVRSMQAGGST
jgi:hypothetical protein